MELRSVVIESRQAGWSEALPLNLNSEESMLLPELGPMVCAATQSSRTNSMPFNLGERSQRMVKVYKEYLST
jgi:hypothetical protein